MDFASFLQDKKNQNKTDEDTGESKVNFAKGIDEKELDPLPKAVKRPASSRLNDMLYSAPPEEPLASAPEQALEEAGEEYDFEEDEEVPSKWIKIKEELLKFYDKVKKNLKKSQAAASKKTSSTLGVNLVKDEIIDFFDWQKNILFLFMAIFIALFLVTVVYWGISFWGIKSQAGKDELLSQDYYRVSREIRELEPQIQEMKVFQDELGKVNFLMKRHVYWTRFFDFLEKNTLADVYFFDFAGNTSGTYVLTGRARYFEVLDAQKKRFLEDEAVTSAKITSGSLVSEKGSDVSSGVSFTVTLTVNPDIFYK